MEKDEAVLVYDGPCITEQIGMDLMREDRILVLGTIDDNWLHVKVYKAESGEKKVGYVSALRIGKSDAWKYVWIDAGEADQTVKLRERPEKSAKVLGRYFSDVQAYSLYDDHTAEDGWQKVMIGTKVGYIMDDFLKDNIDDRRLSFRPPMTEINRINVDVYTDETGKEILGCLNHDDPFQVLGIYGKYYQIRIEGLFGAADSYGFIGIGDVKEQPERSAKTQALTNQDTPCYGETSAGNFELQHILPKGTAVTVYYAIRDCNEGESIYIYPEAKYLFIFAEFPNSFVLEAYVPIDCIDYDKSLAYPEIMTLG